MSAETDLNHRFIAMIEKCSQQTRKTLWQLIDFAAFSAATFGGYILFDRIIRQPLVAYFVSTLLSYALYGIISNMLAVSKRMNRYTGMKDLVGLFFVTTSSVLLSGMLCRIWMPISWRLIAFTILLTVIFVMSPRVIWHAIYGSRNRPSRYGIKRRRAFVIGAGDGGALFMEHYRRNPNELEIVGIIDNDENKRGQYIGNVEILGNHNDIIHLSKEYDVQEAIVAIPSLAPDDYMEILELCNQSGVSVFKMPRVEDVIQGRISAPSGVTKVEIADLLGRKEIQLEEGQSRRELEGKTILVTGAGGSIGSEICRQVLRFNPKRLILLGHGENSIYLIYHELLKQHGMTELIPVIADIQDYERMLQVFQSEKPHIVYHAAAHKHVPLMEWNPREAMKNNIIGTYNVAKAVHEAHIDKMVMISSDKAVNPPNVMGASKRIAELIVTGFNQLSQSTYCAVRFGNVLGSRGSVIPVFEKQIAEGGPITITDFRMTRYFMTIPEASRLVIHAGSYARDGEVFILDMGDPVKIIDLAKKMILLSGYTPEDIEIIQTGKRPGEKLYEELITDSELVKDQIEKEIFIGKVCVIPLEDIETFIEEVKSLDDIQLKERVIAFANNSIK